MALEQTKYPNNIRQVSGTPIIFNNDVILECLTNIGVVKITLLGIPDNFWNTTYKLYVVDYDGNASVNNILIDAGFGQTINGASSITINQNSGSVIIRIVDNKTYLATYSYDTTPTPIDTGWLDLNGFTWVDASIRPQYRVIDKQLIFRRSLIVPLFKAGAVIPYSGSPSYEGEVGIAPYTGAGGGVTLNSAGLITFNQGSPVLQDASHYPDDNYTTNWVIGGQRRNADPPVSASYLAYYTGVFLLQITKNGIMRAITLKNIEEGFSNQQIGQSALRYLTAQSIQTQRISDYRDIKDSIGVQSTIVGRAIGVTLFPVINQLNTPPVAILGDRYLVDIAPTGAWVGNENNIAEWDGATWVYTIPTISNQVFITALNRTKVFDGIYWDDYYGNEANYIGLNSDLARHLITHDPSEENETGGYVIPLDTLKAYLT